MNNKLLLLFVMFFSLSFASAFEYGEVNHSRQNAARCPGSAVGVVAFSPTIKPLEAEVFEFTMNVAFKACDVKLGKFKQLTSVDNSTMELRAADDYPFVSRVFQERIGQVLIHDLTDESDEALKSWVDSIYKGAGANLSRATARLTRVELIRLLNHNVDSEDTNFSRSNNSISFSRVKVKGNILGLLSDYEKKLLSRGKRVEKDLYINIRVKGYLVGYDLQVSVKREKEVLIYSIH